MSLNVKISSCIRIGARYSAKCCNTVRLNTKGQELSRATELRYHRVFIEAASSFKCSLDNAKLPFYRSFNSIFGRVGTVASNEVITQLLKSKCLPVLYYGMEACPLRKSQFKSLDFVISSALRKIFYTKSQDYVDACREISGKNTVSENKLCCIFVVNAIKELSEVRQA